MERDWAASLALTQQQADLVHEPVMRGRQGIQALLHVHPHGLKVASHQHCHKAVPHLLGTSVLPQGRGRPRQGQLYVVFHHLQNQNSERFGLI